MKVSIIGYGEVGSSLEKVYKDFYIKPVIVDPYKKIYNDISDVDTINICIPCENKHDFIKTCSDYINQSAAILVIIHSSILLGIVEELKNLFNNISIVHSPVRGVHPNLYEGLKTFVKYIGHPENDKNSGLVAENHFKFLKIKTKITTAKSTIISKLLSTTYYGMCIAFTEDMGKICDEIGTDFDIINDWTKTYNEGYIKLGKDNVTRPVLFRIPDGKHIGGHCVIPNAKLLKNMFPDIKAFDYVLNYE